MREASLIQPVHEGVHQEWEELATLILIDSSGRDDDMLWGRAIGVLSEWSWKDRLMREVYVPSGTPSPETRNGMFHRKLNPTNFWMNSRDGIASFSSRRDLSVGSSSQYLYEESGSYASGRHDPYMAAMAMTVEESRGRPRYRNGSPSREFTQAPMDRVPRHRRGASA